MFSRAHSKLTIQMSATSLILLAVCMTMKSTMTLAEAIPTGSASSSITQSIPTGNAFSTPLDQSARLNTTDDQVSSVFRNMVVVQRKAKDKGRKILFAPSLTFEFSDGPIAMYPMNMDVGYAFSDFFEVYLNFVPGFYVKERPIVKKISDLQTTDGKQAKITYSSPKTQMGVNVLWIPAYGKDSWSPYRIIRSDTFLKFSLANITYKDDLGTGGTGSRFSFMVGKTYFLSQYLNIRLAVGWMQLESFIDSKKAADTITIMESGFVFYF